MAVASNLYSKTPFDINNWGPNFAKIGLGILLVAPFALTNLLSKDGNLYFVFFIRYFIFYYGIGFGLWGIAPIVFNTLKI